jgi:hypothetical protein
MSWRANLRRGRSHLIFCVFLISLASVTRMLDSDQLTQKIEMRRDAPKRVVIEAPPGEIRSEKSQRF